MQIQALLDALGDRTGREILTVLKEGKISSGELAKRVGLSPSALSYHLSKLKRRGGFTKPALKISFTMSWI